MDNIKEMRNGICKPMVGKYFFFGIIVGVTLGLFLMAPLNRITTETSFFRVNITTSEGSHQTDNHSTESFRSLQINETLADKLYKEVRVLCWIITYPKNHNARARHVKETWGKRCNILLFMSTKEDPSLPSIALPVIEDRPNLWGKTKEAFKYVYKHYFDKADWFFKADDDTYSIMENMRYLLHTQNTSDPVYFGYRFKPWVHQGYMSGGAGYVLSKEALRRFVDEALPYKEKCRQENTGTEDVEIGKCLESVGVTPGDSRDLAGKSRFLPISVSPILNQGEGRLSDGYWFWDYSYYPIKRGMECCSDYIISLHYVEPRTMYLLEYIIYHVKHFGLPYNPTFDNSNKTSSDIKESDIIVNNTNSSKVSVTTQSATDKNENSFSIFHYPPILNASMG